jgi:hypothetical protein
MLEGIGKLLATNVKLYGAPIPREAFRFALTGLSASIAPKESGDRMVTLNDLRPPVPTLHLFDICAPPAGLLLLSRSFLSTAGATDGECGLADASAP